MLCEFRKAFEVQHHPSQNPICQADEGDIGEVDKIVKEIRVCFWPEPMLSGARVILFRCFLCVSTMAFCPVGISLTLSERRGLRNAGNWFALGRQFELKEETAGASP